jgi:hypothetical protein
MLALHHLLHAEEMGSPQGLISKITVYGLKRTKLYIVENALDKFLGADINTFNMDDVKAAILDTGILEVVTVDILPDANGNGSTLAVTVSEKWTIFPLPFFAAGSNGIMAGGAFMNANAFGINDKLVAGGFYTSNGWMAMLAYFHAAVKDSFPGWNIYAAFASAESTDTDQIKNELRRYALDSIVASIGFNYPVNGIFTPSFNISFNNKTIKEIDNPLRAPERGAMTIGLQPGISVRTSEWDGYLLSRQSLSLDYELMIGIDSRSIQDSPLLQHISLRADYEKPIIPGFRINLRTGLGYSPFTTELFEHKPSSIADILPGDFSAHHYAGIQAGLEKYIHKWKQGTLSVMASYQGVYSWGPILEDQWDHGLSGAIVFYLAQLAFPAVGLGGAYNIRADYWQGHFTMGMSF